jgi:hypothetical protein
MKNRVNCPRNNTPKQSQGRSIILPYSTWNLAELTTAWLARSSYPDNGFTGSINEFRVYNGVLLPADLAADIAAGPDAIPVPGIAMEINRVGDTVRIRWSTNSDPDAVLEFSPARPGASWSTNGIPAPIEVGDQLQVTVPISSSNAFYRLSN